MRTTSTSWTSGVSGTWTVASNWSGDAVPGESSTVTIAAAPVSGPYTVDIDSPVTVDSVLLDQAQATLEVDSAGTLTTSLTLGAGTLALFGGTVSGTITGHGGLIQTNQAGFGGSASTLQSTTILGSVTLTEELSSDGYSLGDVLITGGLQLGGATAGTLTVVAQQNYYYGLVSLEGNETLTGGTLLLGPNMQLALDDGSNVTLGAKMVVELTSNDQIYAYDGPVLTNDGIIVSTAGTSDISVFDFANNHLLQIAGGSTLTLGASLDTFANNGTVAISAGGEFIEEAGTLTGTGKITVAAGGTYGLGGPDVTLAQLEQPVYAKGAFAALFGTLQNTGLLTIGGSTVPNLIVENGGTLAGGTLVVEGGLQFLGGTLAGIAIASPLDVGAGTVTLGTGTVFDSGGGSIDLQANGSLTLYAGLTLNGLTLDASGGAIDIGSVGEDSEVVLTNDVITIAASSQVAFVDSGTLVNQGTIAVAAGGTLSAEDEIENSGLLSLAAGSVFEGAYFVDNPAYIVNSGSIALTGEGASADISLINTGLLTVGAGATATFDDLSNTGSIAIASGGTFAIQGTIASASLGDTSFATGAVLDLLSQAVFENAGTLAVGSGTALGALAGTGLIEGGIIADHGNGLGNFSGILSSLTYAGTLLLANGQQVYIDTGVTFTSLAGTGSGAIVLGGDGASLSFSGDAVLNAANVTVDGSGTSLMTGGLSYQNLAFTIGKTARITETAGNLVIGYSDASGVNYADIVNLGRISDAAAGTTLTLGGQIANSGTISVGTGATLALDLLTLTNTGTIALNAGTLQVEQATLAQINSIALAASALEVIGTLDLGGGTLSVSGSTFDAVSFGAPLNPYEYSASLSGGTVIDANGATVFGGKGELDSVVWQGTLNVSRPLTALTLGTGFAMTGANGSGNGTINLTGVGASISAGTLAAAVINIGSAETSFGGTFVGATDLEASALAASASLTETGLFARISVGQATFTNAGTIAATVYGGQLSIGDVDFGNSGLITASNGETLTLAAAHTANTGIISLSGAATLDLSLYNYYAQDAQGPSLDNAGTITLAGGNIAELTDNGDIPAVAAVNTGLMSGYGALDTPLVNSGRIAAAGGTLSVNGDISGAGTLSIGAGSELVLTGSVGPGQAVTFGGKVGELGLGAAGFLGTLSGLAGGDKIDLLSVAASAASFVGHSIVVTLSAGGTIALANSIAETGTIKVTSDGEAGSLLTITTVSAHPADALPWHH